MYNVDSMYKNKELPFDILQNSNLTYVSYHTTDFTAKELLKGFRGYLQKKSRFVNLNTMRASNLLLLRPYFSTNHTF